MTDFGLCQRKDFKELCHNDQMMVIEELATTDSELVTLRCNVLTDDSVVFSHMESMTKEEYADYMSNGGSWSYREPSRLLEHFTN